MPQSGYIFDAYISEARRRLGPEVKRRMILGGFVPSAGYAGKYYLKALKVKSRLSKEIAQAFKKIRHTACPYCPNITIQDRRKNR